LSFDKSSFEVADVFRISGDKFLNSHRLTSEQKKAINDIQECRTQNMGGHTTYCPSCGIIDISYNSCRNRNCPKCGFQKKIKWLYLRKKDVLPITYFHVVFTLPQELNSIFLIASNQKQLYHLFFQSVSKTIELLSNTKKYYSGKTGMIAILHTWGQSLSFHPHIHCILTGGGLDKEKERWIDKKEFLFPVKVMARLFRNIFLKELKKLTLFGKVTLPCSLDIDEEFIPYLNQKEWIVYCKEPFRNPNNLIEYLGRYTHRIAISNHRILEVTNENVSFHYKDYRDGKQKIMLLSHDEFTRRFLQHVVPSGFMRIRYFGILANPFRKNLLRLSRLYLKERLKSLSPLPDSLEKYYIQITGQAFGTCKHCKTGIQIVMEKIPPKARDSPEFKQSP